MELSIPKLKKLKISHISGETFPILGEKKFLFYFYISENVAF